MTKNISLLIIFIISLCLVTACKKTEKQAEEPKASVLEDSALEREVQATELIAKYPMSEWGNDFMDRVRAATGDSVSEDVKKLVQERFSSEEIKDLRLNVLTDLYTASELAKLNEICSSAEGKAVIRKYSRYDDRLKELAAPLIVEVLSNAR